MTDDRTDRTPTDVDRDRAARRAADLLPEEEAAGSADPAAQAAAILHDSDLREAGVESAPDLRAEHRTSEETVPPGERSGAH
jgi:hypothetical protein